MGVIDTMITMHRRWRDDRPQQEDPLLADVHPEQSEDIYRMPSCKNRQVITQGRAARFSLRRCDFVIGYEKKGVI